LKITTQKLKSWQRVLEIEVPAEKVNDQLRSAYAEYRKRAVIPGFRRGKAPLSILKARYADAVEQSVLQELIPQVWEEALNKEKIRPIAEPVIDEVHFAPDEPLRFKATVEVKPDIPLNQYTGFRVQKREVRIDEEEVKRSLRALQERYATVEPSAEGSAGETDIVQVDSWRVDQGGIPIVGHQTTDVPIDLSAPHIIEEYRQALVGASVGDQKRVTVTYPDDHPNRELAGQTISYLLKVKGITKKTLPALDDDFARSAGDYKSIKELEEDLRRSLREQEGQRAAREAQEAVIDQIIEKNPFEVPDSMVAGYVESLIADLHPQNKEEDKDQDRDQLRRAYHPLAVRAVKRWFLLEEIGQREKIEVGDQELQDRIASLAASRHLDPQELSAHLVRSDQLNQLRRNIREEKILDFLIGASKIVSVPAEEKGSGKSPERKISTIKTK
jgi:trigger factor